ncbi:hypothetical protein K4L44_10780 [Halosquirtibacter laminarini]|uniref:Uncharacterized protein n=1 Tax=Halosquirtibacter laminarini TaxID=3374600 RepID=A0AC61NC58_9BACT|nr:hypothetical protein K4L44_10780 [Prolixibacteraceae bacterium]
MKKVKGISWGIITGCLIALYLSGVIIDIPNGTHKGGLMSAIGVCIIISMMYVIVSIVNWVLKKKQI